MHDNQESSETDFLSTHELDELFGHVINQTMPLLPRRFYRKIAFGYIKNVLIQKQTKERVHIKILHGNATQQGNFRKLFLIIFVTFYVPQA